jgi:ABC-type phosphate transport system permease subunit
MSAEEWVRLLTEELGELASDGACWVGFGLALAIGFAVLIVGRISFLFNVWSGQAKAADQPQTAFTTKTPRQVVSESDAARRKLVGCQFLLILVCVLLVILGFLSGVLESVLTLF